jgi:hypothetical protein
MNRLARKRRRPSRAETERGLAELRNFFARAERIAPKELLAYRKSKAEAMAKLKDAMEWKRIGRKGT